MGSLPLVRVCTVRMGVEQAGRTGCGFDALEDVGAGLEDEAEPLRVQSAGHVRVWRAGATGGCRVGWSRSG